MCRLDYTEYSFCVFRIHELRVEVPFSGDRLDGHGYPAQHEAAFSMHPQANDLLARGERAKDYLIKAGLSVQYTRLCSHVKARWAKRNLVVFVDNCYGEFVEDREPCHVGADLIAGSLIKNPGGTIAKSGD